MGKVMRSYREAYIMFKRQMLIMIKNPDGIITAVGIPSLLMLLFVSVFGGAMNVGEYSYVNFVAFAIIMQACGQVSSIGATAAFQDLNGGMIDRFRSMPITQLSFLMGHVLAGIVRNMIAVAGMLAIAHLLGFSATAGWAEWGHILLILLLSVTVFAWMATLLSLSVKSAEAAAGLPALVALLPFFSSGFAPIDTLPAAIQGFARIQPLTPIIDTLRSLAFASDLGASWAVAWVWLVGLILLFQGASLWVFVRKCRG